MCVRDVWCEWISRSALEQQHFEECSSLYSSHYGVWGSASGRSGQRIRLSAQRVSQFLPEGDSGAAFAWADGRLVGYAFARFDDVPDRGRISWVTQLVVHSDYQNQGVAKRLLGSIWGFSNDYAWGIVTANPYAVRALEKMSRRRVQPAEVARNMEPLQGSIMNKIPYLTERKCAVDDRQSVIDTQFYVDHSKLPERLKDVTDDGKPWNLGDLSEGEEWLAVTFRDQAEFPLSRDELESMFQHSERIVREAYARMTLDGNHTWMRHSSAEVEFAIRTLGLTAGSSCVDFGCGTGRHVIELAKRGVRALGLDSVEQFIEKAQRDAEEAGASLASFRAADCRTVSLGRTFDAATCLYDVIGSYPDEQVNREILDNVVRHVRPGGMVMVSVMNMELTESRAIHRAADVLEDPSVLAALRPSDTMQRTGNVFNPEYYLIDRASGLVFRKEQFSGDEMLPAELVVRDRRYRLPELVAMCVAAGLDDVEARYVQAGRWDTPLGPTDDGAKEILCWGRKR